jgi:hypothetical protein
MAKTIEDLFLYFAIYSSLLPILFYCISYSLLKKKSPLRLVIIYASVEFITNILTLNIPMSATIALYAIFTVVEYCLFASIFFKLFISPRAQKVLLIVSACYLIFWAIYKIFGKYSVLDSVPIGVASILIMIFIFIFFYQEMENVSDTFLYNRYTFWIASGILIYLAGSFFLYVLANQVDSKTRHAYWMFANMCTIVKNIAFFISILTLTHRKRSAFSASPTQFIF